MSTETLVDEVVEEARKIDAILTELVQEKGEGYVYREDPDAAGSREVDLGLCYYAKYDEDERPTGPSCIVGHLLSRLGASASDLATYERKSAVVAASGWVEFSHVRAALRRAQAAQDAGQPWSAAHQRYRTYLAENGVEL